jgi:hypothetical protein
MSVRDSPQKYQQLPRSTSTGEKKAFFNNQPVSDTKDHLRGASDDGAIDDDDQEWEDDNRSSEDGIDLDGIDFGRVASTKLPPPLSLITLGLKKSECQPPGNIASQSTSALPSTGATLSGPSPIASPNEPANASSMERACGAATMRPVTEVPGSAAQPIVVTARKDVFSRRPMRPTMLAIELTGSLKQGLDQGHFNVYRTSTANAVPIRKDTSEGMVPEVYEPFMDYDRYFKDPFKWSAEVW